MRWLTAELIPFGCLAAGFVIARAWPPVIALGFLAAALAVTVALAAVNGERWMRHSGLAEGGGEPWHAIPGAGMRRSAKR